MSDRVQWTLVNHSKNSMSKERFSQSLGDQLVSNMSAWTGFGEVSER